jgi:aryl-alcohol dehydrogenase-like predicted oxidoreductase
MYVPSEIRYDAMPYNRCDASGLKPPAISLGLWHNSKAGYCMWPGPYGEWGSRKYILSNLDHAVRQGKALYAGISNDKPEEQLHFPNRGPRRPGAPRRRRRVPASKGSAIQ